MEAIILAGGFGTRLRDAVPLLPKPMAPVGGVPFLERLMKFWAKEGVDHFIISVGYLQHKIVDYFGSSFIGKKVTYSIEKEPLGTGGALLLASQKLNQDCPFLVLNGDTYFDLSLIELWRFHKELKADITVALTKAGEDNRYGRVERNLLGEIVSFGQKGVLGSPYVNGGVYLFDLGLWDDSGPITKLSLENDLFPSLLSEGITMMGVPFSGRFIDIGVPEDYLLAQSFWSGDYLQSVDKK